MVDENEWLARFEFEDALRPEAVAVAARLRAQGCELVLLSGDRASVVEPVARALGIASYRAGAGPDAKARHVADLAAQGATVAMVGDGVNDAPVLARAHVAIALGAGAALARSQADLVLVNPSLEALTEAIDTARALRRVIRQNLGWALGYNVIALPLALAGMLEPWIASLGMSLSSLVVIANALRLARAPRRPRAASFDLRPAPSAS
jgi:Cu2+-exporting ATPase